MHTRRANRCRLAVRTFACMAALSSVLVVVTSADATPEHRASLPRTSAKLPGTTLPGTNCPAFPADNVWNTPIGDLPVDANSATWLASMDSSSTYLHPDYGPSGNPRAPYGIPWQVVPPRTPFTRVTFLYASESYRGGLLTAHAG